MLKWVLRRMLKWDLRQIYVYINAVTILKFSVSVMRLGKKKEKEKDPESKCQTVDGVLRLICSARASHTSPMRGKHWFLTYMFINIDIQGGPFLMFV